MPDYTIACVIEQHVVLLSEVYLICKQTFNSFFRYTGQGLFKDFSTGEGGIFLKRYPSVR